MKYVPMKRTGKGASGICTYLSLPNIRTTEEVDFVVLGTPFDTLTTARPGTRSGPTAIREAYATSSFNTDLRVNLFEHLSGVDYGDIPVFNGNTEKTFASITSSLKPILEAGVIPINLGGDHAIAFPELMAYKAVYGKVAIVHFDSHSDTGYHEMDPKAPYDHGTPFKDAIENDCVLTEHSIQVGMRGLLSNSDGYGFAKRSGMQMITARDGHEMGIDAMAAKIKETVGDAPVFVTFDIDFLDPAYAPGTGTPEGGGFSSWEALELIRKGLLGANIKGFDIVCVNPFYDVAGITGMAASRIVYEFISLLACKKAGITAYHGYTPNISGGAKK